MRGILLRRVRVAVLRIARAAPASIGVPVPFQALQPDAALARLDHCRAAVLAMQPMPQRIQRLRGHQIGLVQHQQIGRAQLPRHRVRQQGIGRRLADRGGVDQHRHAFKLQHRIGQPDLRDARGVGHAAGFDHDPFRQRIQRQHPRQRLVEPPASEQQTQPLASRSTCPALSASRPASTSTGPKSFTSTAARRGPAPAHGSAAWSCPRQETADHGQRDASALCAVHLRRPRPSAVRRRRCPTPARPSGARPAKPRDHPPARRSPHACRPRWSRPDDPCAAYRPRPA